MKLKSLFPVMPCPAFGSLVLTTFGLIDLAGAAWTWLALRAKSDAVPINVGGTRNVLELMQDLAIPKGVYTSTLGVNEDTGGQMVDETHRYAGPYFSEYTRTKAEAHRLAETFIADGLPLVIVMPGLTYGPGDASAMHVTLVQYLQHQLPLVPRRAAFYWAHVDDMARAHILAMEKGHIRPDVHHRRADAHSRGWAENCGAAHWRPGAQSGPGRNIQGHVGRDGHGRKIRPIARSLHARHRHRALAREARLGRSDMSEPFQLKDGYLLVPDKPGQGIEWNEKAVAGFAQ